MINEIITECGQKIEKTIAALKKDFASIRTGKANPSILNCVLVEYYGSMMPVNQIANVSAPDPQTILIKPYDKSVLKGIEKAIQTANLGFNPLNDGDVVRIPIAPLTEQTRKDLVKQAKKNAENAKVAIRNVRREYMEMLKKMEKDGEMSEDELKRATDKVQKVTDEYILKIDQLTKTKEDDIMSI